MHGHWGCRVRNDKTDIFQFCEKKFKMFQRRFKLFCTSKVSNQVKPLMIKKSSFPPTEHINSLKFCGITTCWSLAFVDSNRKCLPLLIVHGLVDVQHAKLFVNGDDFRRLLIHPLSLQFKVYWIFPVNIHLQHNSKFL